MKYFAACLAFAIGFSVFADQTNYDYYRQVELRKEKVLQLTSVKENPGQRYYFSQIATKLRLGQDIDKCREDFLYQVKNPSNNMFFGTPMLACYLYGYKYWTEEIHKAVKDVWRTYLPGRGDTENHWLLNYTAMLLAAQLWPNNTDKDWANGRTTAENYKDAYDYINYWIKLTTTIGTGEFDSTTYLQTYAGALLVLYDFVEDPILKLRVKMILDWTMADYAIDYLSGAYTGGHSRIYDRDVLAPGREGGDVFGYIYFGDASLPSDCPELGFAVYASLSSYHMPQIIQQIATDRSKPYLDYKRRRVRNIIRYSDDKNPPVYKTNYMSKNFSIGCLDGGMQQPIQIHTWGITYLYNNAAKFDEVFSIHPDYSEKELAMFFPEKAKTLVTRVVGGNKGTYNKDYKWSGGSFYERTFQYKNTIILLYDIPDSAFYKEIDYHFPKNLTKREDDAKSGWIFCQGGENTYIALKPFKSGVWSEDDTCFRYRSKFQKNGLVATAFEASDFKSWDDFKSKISATKVDTANLDKNVEVSYTTLDGTVLKFQYPDKRFINGKPYSMDKMPLFKSPYMNGNDGVLDMVYGKNQMTLDFNKNEIINKVNN